MYTKKYRHSPGHLKVRLKNVRYYKFIVFIKIIIKFILYMVLIHILNLSHININLFLKKIFKNKKCISI
jgi:hypothetical protein